MIIAIDRKGAVEDMHAKGVCFHPHLASPVKGEDYLLVSLESLILREPDPERARS